MNSPTPQGVASTIGHRTFAALVQDDTDLVGHVAYALYKRDKLKFCDAEQARTSAPATQASIDVFIRGSNLDTRITSYREEAERLLEKMTEYVLEAAIEEVKTEYQEQLVQKLSEGKSWRRSIAENLAGSVVVALVWALIVLVISTNRVGFDQVLGDALGKNITDRPTHGTPGPSPPSSPSR